SHSPEVNANPTTLEKTLDAALVFRARSTAKRGYIPATSSNHHTHTLGKPPSKSIRHGERVGVVVVGYRAICLSLFKHASGLVNANSAREAGSCLRHSCRGCSRPTVGVQEKTKD